MTEAARSYEDLMRELLEGRARGEFQEGTSGETREDEILERMDDVWWRMSDAERADAEQRVAEAQRIRAPEALDAIDVVVPSGGGFMPRRVAA